METTEIILLVIFFTLCAWFLFFKYLNQKRKTETLKNDYNDLLDNYVRLICKKQYPTDLQKKLKGLYMILETSSDVRALTRKFIKAMPESVVLYTDEIMYYIKNTGTVKVAQFKLIEEAFKTYKDIPRTMELIFSDMYERELNELKNKE